MHSTEICRLVNHGGFSRRNKLRVFTKCSCKVTVQGKGISMLQIPSIFELIDIQRTLYSSTSKKSFFQNMFVYGSVCIYEPCSRLRERVYIDCWIINLMLPKESNIWVRRALCCSIVSFILFINQPLSTQGVQWIMILLSSEVMFSVGLIYLAYSFVKLLF